MRSLPRVRWIVSSMLALAAACGGGSGDDIAGDPDARPDAVSPDASPDADPSTLVTVRVRYAGGQAGVGIPVFGHDANGALIDQTVTDAAGDAYVAAPADGSITVHSPSTLSSGDAGDWYSVLAVAPGDDILVHIGGSPGRRQTALTTPALPSGADRLRVGAPCGDAYGNSSTATLNTDLVPDCPTHGTVVLTAENQSGTPLGYIVIPDADFTQPITTTGPWVAPSSQFTVNLTGFPSSGGSLALTRGALAGGFPVSVSSVSATTTTSTFSTTRFRPDTGDGVVYEMYQGNNGFCTATSQNAKLSRAADVASFSFDVSTMLAPITNISFADHQMSWTGGGGGLGVLAGFSAAQSSGDVVEGVVRNWFVVAPAGTNTVHFPRDTGFTWPVAAQSGNRFISGYVSETASTRWTSYADLRQHHDENPPAIAADFTTRQTIGSAQYAYAGCPFVP